MSVKRRFQLWMIPLIVLTLGAPLYWKHHNTTRPALAKIYFYDKSERRVSLDDFKGKVVLVNLWAAWCAPCMKELPSLARLQEKLPRDQFQVVAISLDRVPVKTPKGLAAYHDKDRQVPLKWKFGGLPTSYLLDRGGNLIKRYDGGYEWDQAGTLQDVTALLR